jgi:hypothetical protein
LFVGTPDGCLLRAMSLTLSKQEILISIITLGWVVYSIHSTQPVNHFSEILSPNEQQLVHMGRCKAKCSDCYDFPILYQWKFTYTHMPILMPLFKNMVIFTVSNIVLVMNILKYCSIDNQFAPPHFVPVQSYDFDFQRLMSWSFLVVE